MYGVRFKFLSEYVIYVGAYINRYVNYDDMFVDISIYLGRICIYFVIDFFSSYIYGVFSMRK